MQFHLHHKLIREFTSKLMDLSESESGETPGKEFRRMVTRTLVKYKRTQTLKLIRRECMQTVGFLKRTTI